LKKNKSYREVLKILNSFDNLEKFSKQPQNIFFFSVILFKTCHHGMEWPRVANRWNASPSCYGGLLNVLNKLMGAEGTGWSSSLVGGPELATCSSETNITRYETSLTWRKFWHIPNKRTTWYLVLRIWAVHAARVEEFKNTNFQWN